MTTKQKNILLSLQVLFVLCSLGARAKGSFIVFKRAAICVSDTPPPSNGPLPYPWEDQSYGPPMFNPDGGLYLNNPSNIKTDVQYNPKTGKYDVYQKMGNLDYRIPTEMDSDEYEDYMFHQAEKNYFKQKTAATSLTKQQQKGLIPPIHIGGKAFEMIFGSNTVNIRPQGSAELTFGFNNSKILNPALPVAQRSLTTFNFDENIQLNVVGEIGDKLKLTTNYNTKATFDFQNQMKLGYTGHEDDIIKSIDAGNITFPLPGTLITGSQSLFGIKTKLQFGRLTSTLAYAQEKGEKKTITVQNGSQTSNFNIKCDQYQANQHYFLSLFFEQQYDSTLAHLPIINTTLNITKIEVWVTNTTTQTQNTRSIIAYSDLGESYPNLTNRTRVTMTPPHTNNIVYPPSDTINSLDPAMQIGRNPGILTPTSSVGVLQSEGFQPVTDFEKIDLARMLNPSEFTVNPKLGYISLKQPLNYDQVLAVAYQYTYKGKVYQVGQFSTDGVAPGNELMVKMLKSTNVSPRVPIWNLMMKNIYALGSYQVNPQNFLLNIWYSNPATGVDIPYFPAGSLDKQLLIDVFKLDQLDQQGDRVADGLFDFLNGVTIDAANGLIIFPTVQPYGKDLKATLVKAGYDSTTIKTLVFQALYDSVLVIAQQQPNLNRYYIRGSYQSSASSDISLNALNVPPGSVIVTAGGIKLTENVDYSVDYTLGRVKILNQGLLSSGTPIQISLENNALFSIQSKTFAGAHFDYMFSKDFTLGATAVNYTEHPLTQIVSIGQEPVSNTMLGLNEDFKKEAPWLTNLIDKLPMIHTKAPSEITASTEAAAMIPGHPKYIGATGNAYIDDFEGSESFIDISQPFSWSLASIPQLQPSVFPEAQYNDTLAGFNRAKVAWYVVDPLFQQNVGGTTPSSWTASQMSQNSTRLVLQTELFPNEQSPTGTPINLPVLNVGYYPGYKGPYNYDVAGTRFSAGIDQNGNLLNPKTRWGGIQRPIQETDFETDNIGFIEFWMMDPWNSDVPASQNNTTGTLYFDLGDVSEDVLKDGLKEFENGLPSNASDYASGTNANNPFTNTSWGRVPSNPSLVNAFNNDPNSRPYQDVGLDGMVDTTEARFFSGYLNAIKALYGANSAAYINASNDPSSDDYNYYRDDKYDAGDSGLVARYWQYNGLEGNSPTSQQYATRNPQGGNYPTTASTLPNTEDINQDNTLSTDETYYEYSVQMTPPNVHNNVGNNFITNSYTATVTTPDGNNRTVTWYQFKIPISDYIRKVGPIADFKSIRFIRMYFKNFDKPVLCRFAKLELVRDDWRKYTGSLLSPGDYITSDNQTPFDTYGVNLEENASRTPVNYVIPPGIQRQLNLQSANLVQQNEQSLALHICDLKDGDARAVYKTVQLDMRSYKKVQMFVHCESADPGHTLKTGDVQAFVRIGSDFVNNYYEYAVPCQITPPGNYSSNNQDDQYAVWPDANTMVISLSTLENAKLARDAAMLSNPNITLQTPYSVKDGNNIITIVGNPTISNTQIIMLGVRNPKRTPSTASTDDGQSKCTEVWFDELRMTDFSEKGGVAAISRVTAKLADLGSLSLSGKISTPGFGSLETKVSDLSRETDEGFDIATNLEMGKFLPQNWGVSVPMYLGYSKQIIIPEYNPLDPDILMSQELSSLNSGEQTQLKNRVFSQNTRKSMNFTNVHKNRGKNSKKSHIYDIENFSGTYSYSELSITDVNTKTNLTRNYMGALTYAYSFHPKNIQPLGKSEFFKKRRYLALIGDFNFFPYPDKFSATSTITREYKQFELQNNIPGLTNFEMPISVSKTFNTVTVYNLGFPLSKSLKLDYMATNDTRILEPEGQPIQKPSDKDSVWSAFVHKQETTDFKQSVNATYEIPINKLPGLDFVNLSAHYTGTFEWVHAPYAADTLGATIQNSGLKSIQGQMNFTQLYNKIGFIKKYLQENSMSQQAAGPLATKNNPLLQKAKQPQPANKNATGSPNIVLVYLAHIITTVKNASANYSDNSGSILPGFKTGPSVFGMNEYSSTNPKVWTPTPGVVFGQTMDTGVIRQGNWLVNNHSPSLSPFTTTRTQTFTAHISLEPIPDMKIDLTGNRTLSHNTSQYYYDSAGMYKSTAFSETGNFSMSFWSLKTIFIGSTGGNASSSSLFQAYLANRAVISSRLQQQNNAFGYSHSQFTTTNPDGSVSTYYNGYSGISQNVVIPAFIAAYSGRDPNKVSLNPFPAIPYPNYTLTYSGLSKIKWVKKHLQGIIISSAYTSTYTVGGYNYNQFLPNPDAIDYIRDVNGDFLPRDQIPTISISDALSPLIKIAVTFKSNVSSNLEVRTDRQVALNMSDLTINEIHGTNYIIGLGYKIKNVLFPIKIGGKAIRNDMNIRADFSLRQSETILRNTENLSNQVTGGQSILSIKSQVEYMINTRLSLRLYFDKIINTPYISSSYPTSTMDGGLAIRFSLS